MSVGLDRRPVWCGEEKKTDPKSDSRVLVGVGLLFVSV